MYVLSWPYTHSQPSDARVHTCHRLLRAPLTRARTTLAPRSAQETHDGADGNTECHKGHTAKTRLKSVVPVVFLRCRLVSRMVVPVVV
jgi:hypothetical protein